MKRRSHRTEKMARVYDDEILPIWSKRFGRMLLRRLELCPKMMILDVGPGSANGLAAKLSELKTLVWNGPLGAFEVPPFDAGTVMVARVAADLTRADALKTVAGGGDTVAALNQAGVAGDFSYVSTAGGAFLEWMEGKPLPGVEVLKNR